MKAQPSDRLVGRDAPSFLASVEEELTAFLFEKRKAVEREAPEAVVLVDELSRTLGSGGKRLRPLFCYWGHLAAGGRPGGPIARAGGAVELLHTSAVIHDDVLDRSRLRRGHPTAFRHLSAPGSDPPRERPSTGRDASRLEGEDRFGRSAAILAGDLAGALADELLARSGFPSDRLVAAFRPWSEMRAQAVAGELLDLVLAERRTADEAEARRVASLKSASYTVVGPLLVGATLGGAGPDVLGALAAFGWPLGEAFQLRDDVLGTFGDPAVTGKDRDTDILEGKQTTLVAKARRLADERDERIMAERLGRDDLDGRDVDRIRAILRGSGALAETLGLVESLAERAVGSLENAAISPEAARALRSLALMVAVRDA